MPRIFDAQLFEDTAQNLLFIELNHKQPDIKILSTSIIINTSFGVCFFGGVNNFDASSPTLMPLGAPTEQKPKPFSEFQACLDGSYPPHSQYNIGNGFWLSWPYHCNSCVIFWEGIWYIMIKTVWDFGLKF